MKTFFSLLFAVALCGVSGCGYQVGFLMHPQIKSVAVAPVVNETVSYNAAAQLRGLLSERVMSDGSLTLKSMSQADCIIYAKVTKVDYSEVNWATRKSDSDENFEPNEWRCSVSVTYSVVLPGRGTPLISSRVATGSVEFVGGPDIENSRLNGLRQAMYEASKIIISDLTEAW